MKVIKIKSKKQDNGIWGSPINLVKIDDVSPFLKNKEKILQNLLSHIVRPDVPLVFLTSSQEGSGSSFVDAFRYLRSEEFRDLAKEWPRLDKPLKIIIKLFAALQPRPMEPIP